MERLTALPGYDFDGREGALSPLAEALDHRQQEKS